MNRDKEPLITAKEAAALLGLSVETLKDYRNKRMGPRCYKLAPNAVRYRRSDVLAYREARANGAEPEIVPCPCGCGEMITRGELAAIQAEILGDAA